MIYEIYIQYHDEKYSPSVHTQNESKAKPGKGILRPPFKQLPPYRIPQDHYDTKKITNSLHYLTQRVKENKEKNKNLASRIFYNHGKPQTRRFLHLTKQIFGKKLHALKNIKMASSQAGTARNSSNYEPVQNSAFEFVENKELFFETYRPDFTIRTKRQPHQIRQNRRYTLGIKEADLKNFQEVKRGLPRTNRRKQKRKDIKDLKKPNMKGFTAKISANLQLRQKVSTQTLVRLMNVKFLGDTTLKKIRT